MQVDWAAEGIGMKLMKMLALAVLVGCMPLAAFADGVDFSNSGGQIIASGPNGGNTLTLTSTPPLYISTLMGVTGLGIDSCGSASACGNGTVTFTTGSQGFSGSLIGNASWGNPSNSTPMAGSSITIMGNAGGAGGAFSFTGSFSSATWTETIFQTPNGPLDYWAFNGAIVNGTLIDNLGTFTGLYGGHFDITQLQVGSGNGTWDNGSGNTVVNVVPELGTLTLLGSGLVVIGVFARRRLSKNTSASQ